MRTLLFTVTILLLAHHAHAQGDPSNDPIGFRFKRASQGIIAYPASANGAVDKTITRHLDHSVWFSLGGAPVNPNSGDTLVQIYVPGTAQAPPAQTSIGLSFYDSGRYFWIQKTHLDKKPKTQVYDKWVWALSVGLISMPVTYRPVRGALAPIFDGATNINSSIGFKRRLSETEEHYIMPFVAAGIQAIRMSSVNNTAITDATAQENAFGLLLGGGLTFTVNKAQFGFMVGTDLATGDLSRDYAYQGAPWFGISLGTTLTENLVGKGGSRSQ